MTRELVFILLYLVSFLPLLLSLFLNSSLRLQSMLFVFSLGILVMQTVSMDVRWQLFPVYLLMLCCSLALLLNLLSSKTPKWLSVTCFLMSLGLLGSSAFLSYLLPVIILPEPTGVYQVGTRLEQANDVMIRLWYPAKPDETVERYRYLEGLDKPVLGIPGFVYSHLKSKTTVAYSSAEPSENEQGYPVILYTHGADSFAEENSLRFMELASHGFILAAIEHPIPFKTYHISAKLAQDPEAFTLRLTNDVLPNRVKDVHTAVQKLEELNRTDAQFQGKLELNQLAASGFSFGGSVASEYCFESERCKAIINLDGNAFGKAKQGLNSPYLQLSQSVAVPQEDIPVPETTMQKTSNHYRQEVKELLRNTKEQETTYWLQIKGTGHASFTDLIHWTPARFGMFKLLLGESKTRETVTIINQLTLEFLKEHLSGKEGFDETIKKYNVQKLEY